MTTQKAPDGAGDRGRFSSRRKRERVHRDRYPPCQHPAAVPVHHGGKIHEAPRHGDVRDGFPQNASILWGPVMSMVHTWFGRVTASPRSR